MFAKEKGNNYCVSMKALMRNNNLNQIKPFCEKLIVKIHMAQQVKTIGFSGEKHMSF